MNGIVHIYIHLFSRYLQSSEICVNQMENVFLFHEIVIVAYYSGLWCIIQQRCFGTTGNDFYLVHVTFNNVS